MTPHPAQLAAKISLNSQTHIDHKHPRGYHWHPPEKHFQFLIVQYIYQNLVIARNYYDYAMSYTHHLKIEFDNFVY